MPDDSRKFTGACIDPPSEADTYETKLRDGDIVLTYVCYAIPPSHGLMCSCLCNPD